MDQNECWTKWILPRELWEWKLEQTNSSAEHTSSGKLDKLEWASVRNILLNCAIGKYYLKLVEYLFETLFSLS